MAPSTSSSPSTSSVPALRVQAVEKYYGSRENVTRALGGISLDVARGEFVAVMGPSGSGKTTLLNCISTIDRPSAGHILVDGQDVCDLRRGELARFRRERLGFVFQDANLLDTLTARENIALALTINHVAPREVSARAIVCDPALVLADEPTGALDSRNSRKLLECLTQMNEAGATIIMVTHDSFAASYAHRALFIKDGRLFNELSRGAAPRGRFFDQIIDVVSFLGGEDGDAA